MKKIVFSALVALTLVGCGGGGIGGDIDDIINQDVEVGADSLRVDPTNSNTGFMVSWSKKSGGYGEVIYTDDLSKPRGNGYPMTSNSTGSVLMGCSQTSIDSSGVHFKCTVTNVTYKKYITLRPNVEYKWLVSYGTNHQHGSVANILTVDDNGNIEIR